jgi:uncharacterized protein (TIGR03435 family)
MNRDVDASQNCERNRELPSLRTPGILAAIICSLAVSVLHGQTPPAFEVASIKKDTTGENGRWTRFLPGGRFEVTRCQVLWIIEAAYDLRDFQIADAPKWASDWSFLYDIEAKAASPVPDDQLKLMAQQLLADRFQLKVHREMRPVPLYALVVSKNGSRLQAAKDNGRPRGSGGIESVAQGWIRGTNVPVKNLVKGLSQLLDRPVVDQTDLGGPVDFNLQWAPDGSDDTTHPSIFTAIQEQLGLKLESQKLPIEVLVIDHVEQPTAN